MSVFLRKPILSASRPWQWKTNSTWLAIVFACLMKTTSYDRSYCPNFMIVSFLEMVKGNRAETRWRPLSKRSTLTTTPGRNWLRFALSGAASSIKPGPFGTLTTEAKKHQKRKNKSPWLRIPLSSGTSCHYCPGICGSRLGMLSHLRIHQQTSFSHWGTAEDGSDSCGNAPAVGDPFKILFLHVFL